MRAARVGACIIEVTTTATRFKRLVDRGYWNRKALEALERQGFDGVVYLNRYEGIPLQEIENARDRGIDVDRVPDGVFRKAVPSAQDAYKFGVDLGKR